MRYAKLNMCYQISLLYVIAFAKYVLKRLQNPSNIF
jgi:hypothetical protein